MCHSNRNVWIHYGTGQGPAKGRIRSLAGVFPAFILLKYEQYMEWRNSMKGILTLVLVASLFSIGCEKKEPQKAAQSPYSGPVQNQGQLQDHIRTVQEIIRQNPQDVRAWVQLGNMLMDSQRYQEAIDAYRKSLELDPKNVDAMVDMGTCYRNIGQPKKAVEEYKKALAVNPDHINAHRNLGVVAAFDLKDKQLAARELEEYLRLAPGAPDAAQVKQLIASLKTP